MSLYKAAKLKRDVELQEHQQRVVDRMKTTDALLAYHLPGAGKSLASLAATEDLGSREIVVPASLRANYQGELEKFTHGKGPKTGIKSYEAATRGKLKPADALILDESQRIANVASGRSKALLAAAPKYKKRLLLSGTPIKNAPHELGPLAHMLSPGQKDIPLDPGEFNAKFIAKKKIVPNILKRLFLREPIREEQSAKNLDVIRRAFKGKVDYYDPGSAGMPSRKDHIVKVPMGSEQLDIYKTLANKANPVIARKVRNNFPLSKREQSEMNSFLTKTRIASNTARPYGGTSESPKFRMVVDSIKAGLAKDPSHKALVFSSFLEGGVSEMSEMLAKEGIPAAVFKGGMNDAERKAVVENYNAGKTRALLLSAAAAEGISLKGTRAEHILNPQWNQASSDQAIARGIRFGSHADLPERDRNVTVNQYVSTIPRGFLGNLLNLKPDTSVDEYLVGLSKRKQALNDQFLNVLKEEGSRYAGT